MKFYEFNDFGYYALILAKNDLIAIEAYENNIAEIEKEDKEVGPDIISKEKALEKYKMATIEGCKTEKEKVEDFNEIMRILENSKINSLILLIDGSLF